MTKVLLMPGDPGSLLPKATACLAMLEGDAGKSVHLYEGASNDFLHEFKLLDFGVRQSSGRCPMLLWTDLQVSLYDLADGQCYVDGFTIK
jgi:hypothetical protein